jgi:type IV pilus assembly protein PilC
LTSGDFPAIGREEHEMATFTYQALNASGKNQKGTIEAASSEDATQKIKAQGYFPTSVQPVKEKKSKTKSAQEVGAASKKKKKKSGGISFGRVKPKALTLFTRQLSTLQDAGLPLLRSLQILESQQKPGKMKSVLSGVCEEVEGGSSLSESMGKYPKAFDNLYVKMVNAGEIGGVLDLILQRIAEFMEKSERLKRKIKGALVYPVVVMTIAVIILTFIMVFIIPKFKDIFADFEVELPGLTLWLMDTSSWMAGTKAGQSIPGFVFVVLGGPALWISYKLIRKTPPGRAVFDTLLLWTPIFGKLVRKTVIARFTRTLGTLIGAGVPILEAVTITAETSGNYVYEKAPVRCVSPRPATRLWST